MRVEWLRVAADRGSGRYMLAFILITTTARMLPGILLQKEFSYLICLVINQKSKGTVE